MGTPMATRKLYFEAIRLGEELPPLTRPPVDRVQLARYAGASGDFNPVHVDEAHARSLGLPSVYAPGMLVMGMLGQLVSDWSRGAQLRRFAVKFSKIVWPGDTVVAKGRVMERWGDGARYFAEVDLWAENQKGELLLRGSALVQCFYSMEDENRQRSGQPPLLVPVPRESLHAPPPKPPEPRTAAPAASAKKPAPASRRPAPAKKAGKR